MADNKTAKSVLFLSSLTLSFSFCILKFNLCLCKQYLVELGLLIYPNDPSISIATYLGLNFPHMTLFSVFFFHEMNP